MIDKNEAIKQGFAVIEGENSNANAENSSKNTQNLSQNDINSTQNAFLRHIKSKFPHLIRDNTLDFKGVAKILGVEFSDENAARDIFTQSQGYELNFTGKAFANALYSSPCKKSLKLDEIFTPLVNLAKNDTKNSKNSSTNSQNNTLFENPNKNSNENSRKNSAQNDSLFENPNENSSENSSKNSQNFTPQNFIIKGDNLDVLKLLKSAYSEKIKAIYIDPPYNTESDGFIYKDNFREDYRAILRELGLLFEDENGEEKESDKLKHIKNILGTKSHSGWLSFIYPRIKLAYDLLREDGVIFISIDDNEQANLKLLCDEVFGEGNFVTAIPRLTKSQRAGQEKYMDISHDYILVYAKCDDFNHITKRIYNEANVKEDKIGKYIKGDTKAILAAKSQGYSKGGDYDFEFNGKIYKPVNSKGVRNRWLWTKERMEAAAKLGILVETANTLRCQLYLDKKFDEKTNTMIDKDEKMIFHTADFMTNNDYSNSAGDTELENIMGVKCFSNPKPITLIKDLLKLSTSNAVDSANLTPPPNPLPQGAGAFGEANSAKVAFGEANSAKVAFGEANPARDGDIVLDFFAGSGTTAQAVMELNAQDNGNRKFILVQLNEIIDEKKSKVAYDFCKNELKSNVPMISDITIERVKRAGAKIAANCHVERSETSLNRDFSPRKNEAQNDEILAQNDKNLAQNAANLAFGVYSLEDKPEILADEKGVLNLHTKANLSADDRARNLALNAAKRLDKELICLIKDKLYACEDSLFVLSCDEEVLGEISAHKESYIFIDGWGDVDLQSFLNLNVSASDRISIVY